MKNIPEGCESVVALLNRAYPNGIPSKDWDGIMFVLFEHMSNRQLASVVSFFTSVDYMIHCNEVLGIGADGCDPEVVERVRVRLNAAGYDEWVAEEE